jgi:hypothetical protein
MDYNYRAVLKFNRSFGQELGVLRAILSMFSKFSMHAWSWCGGLNKEHSI